MEKTDLAALLPEAKQGNQKAQMAIITAFRPLVMKLAGQEKNLSLRPDLASTLVLGILEAIRKYPGEDPRRFPGFVKTHLNFLLSHYIRKEAPLEQTERETLWSDSGKLHRRLYPAGTTEGITGRVPMPCP